MAHLHSLHAECPDPTDYAGRLTMGHVSGVILGQQHACYLSTLCKAYIYLWSSVAGEDGTEAKRLAYKPSSGAADESLVVSLSLSNSHPAANGRRSGLAAPHPSPKGVFV
jgi:hypothetical protein